MQIGRHLLSVAPALALLTAAPARADTVENVVNHWVDLMKPKVVGVCVGGVDGDDGFIRCTGQTGTPQAFDIDTTLLAMGSITKTFTATGLAVAMQSHPGLLDTDLNSVTNTYAPYVIPPGYLTVRNLADQSSGLPHAVEGPYYPMTLDDESFLDLLECVYNNVPGFSPCWAGPGQPSYSNFGYAVLGAIVANELGFPNDWVSANNQFVVGPLGMTQTGVMESWSSSFFNTHAAVSFTGSVTDGFTQVSSDFLAGSGGESFGALWTTPKDMQTWLKYNMGILSVQSDLATARNVLYQHDFPCYTHGGTVCDTGFTGLAWEMRNTPAGDEMISKGGDIAGFHSFIGFEKSHKKGVWYIVNSDGLDEPSNGIDGELMLDQLN